MQARELRFGVLGTARIARRLVADLQSTDGVSVVAIASRDAARGRWYASQFGIARALDSYAALVADPGIDAVYVPLPPGLHRQWTVAAAEAGKHVLCEKPLATSLEAALAIDAACRRCGTQWLDATAWLHHPRTERMRAAWDALGTVRHTSAACSFFEPFQSDDHRLSDALGGGCLLDLGWYAAGAAVWAAGARPREVYATAVEREGVPFRVSAVVEFDNGGTASFNCGYDTATRKWFEVAGDHAAIVCDDFTRPWPDRDARFWIHNRAGEVAAHRVEPANQERRLVACFRDAAAGGAGSLRAFQSQAIATQWVLEAARRSIERGTPVRLTCEEAGGADPGQWTTSRTDAAQIPSNHRSAPGCE